MYVSLVTQTIILPFLNNVQSGVFEQDNFHPHSAFVKRSIVHMLPWPARSRHLSIFKHIWDIIGNQFQNHPQPALTASVLMQQAWNVISQSDIRHLKERIHKRLQACLQNSGGYVVY
ncbi:uncharacterized protein TNCV_5068461 [Trichonephila clavipes]|nr:uncharacterized protein TNCV_5068461 [Trichonephila clavipes]